MELNSRGFDNARNLIRKGLMNTSSPWSISADEENAILGDPPDWDAYGTWHLGRKPGVDGKVKEAWSYPFGKAGRVYRSALIGVRQRAGQQGATSIFDAAGKLLAELRGADFGEIVPDVEIFRAGTHTSSAGETATFTDEDLDRIATSYDPRYHEAPVVVGHPEDNLPAYGWVRSLRRVGGRLLATLDLLPEFAETVRRGLFKKRSASLYKDLDGKGPYLRHVGFLGALPPAVKALSDINLADTASAATYEFSEERKPMNWRDWFKKKIDEMPDDFGVQAPAGKPAAQFSEEDVRRREEEAARLAREKASQEFAERQKKADSERAVAAHKSALKTRLDGLVKEGKVLPAWMKGGLLQFAESLGHVGEGPSIEFAEGKKQTPYEWFMGFLDSLPKSVNFNEIAGGGADLPKELDTRREKAIENYMEANKATYKEAFLAVSKRQPELFGR